MGGFATGDSGRRRRGTARGGSGMGSAPRGRSDAGSTSLEVVLLVPVMMLLALFVLWAGRGGRAGLIADLAAEEAATAASLACERGQDRECEDLVADVVSARPGLDFLCIGGARPIGDDPLVDSRWFHFGFDTPVLDPVTGDPSEASGVGLFGVRFECETDGAVAPLQGVFPTVTFRGQAVEVAIQQGPPRVRIGSSTVTEGGQLVFVVSLDAPAAAVFVLAIDAITDMGDYTVGGSACTDTPQPDYERPALPMLVTFRQGDIEGTITIKTCDDLLHETDEQIQLTLIDPASDPDTPPVVVINTSRGDHLATGTIEDNDSGPTITVDEPSKVESAGTLQFTATLSAPIGREVTFTYNTARGSGTAAANPGAQGSACPSPLPITGDPVDYIAIDTPVSHVFRPGAGLTHIVRVGLCDDLVGERHETLGLVWSSSPVSFGGTAAGTITDDEPRLSVDPMGVQAGEDGGPGVIDGPGVNGGSMEFTVRRSGITSPEVAVHYRTRPVNPNITVLHWATAGDDYVDVPGDCMPGSPLLNLPPGAANSSGSVTVTLIDDALDEHDGETLWLELCGSSDNVWLEQPWGKGEIIDDDDEPALTVADVTVGEAQGAELSFTVGLSEASGRAVTLEYWTEDDTAAAGDDYTAVSMSSPGTVVFSAGETAAQTFAVGVLDDALDEDDQTMRVRLRPSNAVMDATEPLDPCAPDVVVDDCALGTIEDDDDPPTVTVEDASGSEGTTLRFWVGLVDQLRLSTTSGRQVEVGYRVEHVTTSEEDFTDVLVKPLSGIATIEVGDSGTWVKVEAHDDTLDELDPEQFVMRLHDPQHADIGDSPLLCAPGVDGDACAVGEIADNDDEPLAHMESVVLAGACDGAPPLEACAREGVDMVFQVELSEASGRAVTVGCEATRLASQTYPAELAGPTADIVVPAPCTAEFPVGERRAQITVDTVDDALDEGDEVFLMRLRAVDGGGAGLVDPTARMGTIVDDDELEIGFAQNEYQGAEAASPADSRVEFRVELYNEDGHLTAAGAEVRANFITKALRRPDGAAEASDFVPETSGELVIATGEEFGVITVEVPDDDVFEGDEYFQVELLGPPQNASLGDHLALGLIIDDEAPPTLTVADGSGSEGGQVSFAATLSGKASRDVTVQYWTERDPDAADDRSATAGDDYTAVPENPPSQAVVPALSTAADIGVDALDDATPELSETFLLRLGTPAFAEPAAAGPLYHNKVLARPGLGPNANAVLGTITDNDQPVVSIIDATAAEGDAASFIVWLHDSGGAPAVSSLDVSVTFETDQHLAAGTAAATGGDQCVDGSPTDYVTRQDDRITITSGTRDVPVLVQTCTDDDSGEDSETFLARLVPGTVVNARLGNYTGLGTILDQHPGCVDLDDPDHTPPTLTVADVTVGEARGSALFEYVLTEGFCDPVTLAFATADGTAVAPSDYVAVAGSVAIAPGERTGEVVSVPVNNDTIDEEDRETLQLRLRWTGNMPDAYLNAETVAVATITDDDGEPGLWVADAAATEAAPLRFAVSLRDINDRPVVAGKTVTVEYSTASNPSAGNAAASGDTTCGTDIDYEDTSGTLTFRPGDETITALVTTCHDAIAEPSETLRLRLLDGTAQNAGLRDSAGLGTIEDDDDFCIDPGTDADPPILAVADASSSESLSESLGLLFEVTLSEPFCAGTSGSIAYSTMDGTALAGEDYDSTSRSVGIRQGRTSRRIRVYGIDDDVAEGTETFTLNVAWHSSMPPSYGTAPEVDATGTIEDDDDLPTLSVQDAKAVEGTAVEFTVSLGGPSQGEVTAEYTTVERREGSAAAAEGVDYTPAAGTLVIPADRRSTTVRVDTVDDEMLEYDETFLLHLVQGTVAGARFGNRIATGTIEDDDEADGCVDHRDIESHPPTLALSDAAGREEDGPVTFIASVNPAFCLPTESIIGFISADGTAIAPHDYSHVEGGLSLEALQATAEIVVPVVDDTLREGSETFEMRVWYGDGALGHYQGLPDVVAVGTLTDDDGSPCVEPSAATQAPPALAVAAARADEDAGSMTFTVELDPGFCTAVASALQYATSDGTATAPADYTSVDAAASLSPGQSIAEIAVTIIDDDLSEGGETLQLEVQWGPGLPPRYRNQTPVAATGVIDDDELPCVSQHEDAVAFTVTDADASEGGSIPLRLVLVTPLCFDAAVTASYRAGTADDEDFPTALLGGTATLAWASGSSELVWPHATADDATYELDETFEIVLSWADSMAQPYRSLPAATVTGTIRNDDPLPELSVADADEEEGETITFNVTLDAASSQPVTVRYRTIERPSAEDDAALSNGDYLSVSDTLTFTPGVTLQPVTVDTVEDELDEGDETFLLELLEGTVEGARFHDRVGLGTIFDDDDADECIDLETASLADMPEFMTDELTVDEGIGQYFITVRWAVPFCQDVTIFRSNSGITATWGVDFSASVGGSTAPAGTVSQRGQHHIYEDDLVEGDETFEWEFWLPNEFAHLSPALESLDPIVTIADNDSLPQLLFHEPSAEEGSPLIYLFSLDRPATELVEITYRSQTFANSSADAEYDDFRTVEGTLTIPPGESERSVVIETIDDAMHEHDETMLLRVQRLVGADFPAAQNFISNVQWVGTIIDNDDPPDVSAASVTVAEGQPLTFNVELSGPSGIGVSVNYATEDLTGTGAATAGTDYTAESGTLNFAAQIRNLAGETSKQVTVRSLPDADTEANEAFLLRLSDPVNASLAGDGTARGRIIDDDSVPVLSLAATATAVEGQAAIITARLDRQAARDVTFAYETTRCGQQQATPGLDYPPVGSGPGMVTSPTVTITALAVEVTFEVATTADDADELDETFCVRIAQASSASVDTDADTATVTISDAG